MSSEWPEFSFEQIKAPAKSAFAMGPFGSNIKAENFTTSGVPVIKGGNLNGTYINDDFTDFLTVEKAAELASSQARPLDIVITHRGTLGQVGLIPVSSKYPLYVVSQSQLKLSFDQTQVDPYFIYYFLRSSLGQQRLLANTSQVGVPAIAQALTTIRQIKIALPSLSEQRGICSTLRLIDDRITLLRETNATLEAIAQALFKSWFVDFDPVHAKMQGRPPEGMDESTAALFPDSFEESELGAVPKGWQQRSMSDVSTVGIGKTPPRKEQHWFTENAQDVRWVSIRDMGAYGVYATQTAEFLTAEAIERFNIRKVPDNTVLMSFKMTIGRVAITDGEMTTNEAIAHFKLSPDARLSAEYIYLYLKQFDFTTLSSTSSIADAVNSKTVRDIPVLVPSPEVLNAFQKLVAPLFAELKNTEQQAQTLAALRDILLPRLISGALRLPEAESLLKEMG